MKYSHIATGPHMTGRDARFRINTAPGVMEPTHGVNEAHGSFLQRDKVVELRDELVAWLKENPSTEERVRQIVGGNIDETTIAALLALIEREKR